MATHSSTFAWRISWTEGHGRLQSMELQRGEAYSVLRDDPELHRLVRMKGHCRDQDRYEQRKSRIVCTGKNSKQLAFF